MRHALSFSLVVCFFVGAVYAQTPVTWTGAVDNSYDNPGNWDLGVVPVNNGGNTYEVIIPGGFTVDFDVDGVSQVSDMQLGSGSTLTINPGKSLTVLDDAALAGVIIAENSQFHADAAAAMFTGGTSQIRVSAGATVSVGATSYSSTGLNNYGATYDILTADGLNSTLDLSSLVNIDASGASGGTGIHRISASNSGLIDLSNVQNIKGRGSNNRLEFNIASNGTIDLSSLQTVNQGSVRFNIDAPGYTWNSLMNTNGSSNVQFNMQQAAATFTMPIATSLTNTSIGFSENGTFSAPQLTEYTYSTLHLNPTHTFTSGGLSNIDNSRFSVTNGAVFNDVTATSYATTGLNGYGATYELLKADGAGSHLGLSSLLSINANSGSGAVGVHQIIATNNGTIDLSNVTDVKGRSGDDRLEFNISSGGNVDLSGLETISAGTVHFNINADNYTWNSLQDVQGAAKFNQQKEGSTFNLPALTNLNGGGITTANNGTVDAPVLTRINGTNVDLAPDSALNAPQLTEFTHSQIALDGTQTFQTAGLSNVDNSQFTVSSGATYSDITATSYASTGLNGYGATYDLLTSQGTGSLLDLSSLTYFDAYSDSGATGVHRITATGGSTIDMSNTTTMRGRAGNDRLEFNMSSNGAVDLSGLQEITAGTVHFNIDADSYTWDSLGAVNGGAKFNIQRDGGVFNLPVLTTLQSTSFQFAENTTFDAPSLTELTRSSLTVGPTVTFNTGGLSDIDNTQLSVVGGAVFDEVVATGYSATGLAGYGGQYTLLNVDGVDSLLDMSSVLSMDSSGNSGATGVHRVIVTNDGTADLSGVQTVRGRDGNDRMEFNVSTGGTLMMSSLQSILSGNVYFNMDNGGNMVVGDITLADNLHISVMDFESMLETGSLHMGPGSSLAVGNGAMIKVHGDFSTEITDPGNWMCDEAIMQMNGTTHMLEVAGEDLGVDGATSGNFGLTQLIVGTAVEAATVYLVDFYDNATAAPTGDEALYLYGNGGLDGLMIHEGSVLNLGYLNVYALIAGEMVHINDLFGPGVTSIQYGDGIIVIPEPATIVLLGLGGLLIRRKHAREEYCICMKGSGCAGSGLGVAGLSRRRVESCGIR